LGILFLFRHIVSNKALWNFIRIGTGFHGYLPKSTQMMLRRGAKIPHCYISVDDTLALIECQKYIKIWLNLNKIVGLLW
jgi:hypothetical protein